MERGGEMMLETAKQEAFPHLVLPTSSARASPRSSYIFFFISLFLHFVAIVNISTAGTTSNFPIPSLTFLADSSLGKCHQEEVKKGD